MDKVRLIKVFIASPSDVAIQRDEIEKLIYEWNTEAYLKEEKVFLLPIRWESCSASEYAINSSGQRVIDTQILLNSDVLIAVFGKSLGSPVDGFESGTISEIEKFYKEKKSGVGVFFMKIPSKISTSDAGAYCKVENYRKKLETEKRGLYKSYNDEEIKRFLTKEVNRLKKVSIKDSEGYYEASISDVYKNNRGNFYCLRERIPLNEPMLKDATKYENEESHWIADWNKELEDIKRGDLVKFRIKKISPFAKQGFVHDTKKVYPRNITFFDLKVL